jgi:3-deoxy-D-manno-octulosonic-acid transferase
MLKLYKFITSLSAPILNLLLRLRLKRGKEDAARLHERQGNPTEPRPDNGNPLIWIHAASVGEAQSALILMSAITIQKPKTNFLMTSGTVTSAHIMAKRLPENALHQYIPLDHPKWVESFLDHWQPDLALWMESELWPNILQTIKHKEIPAMLVNARLSDKSFRGWKRLKTQTNILLKSFDLILTQTEQDKIRYGLLGGQQVITAGNLKQSASPLPHDKADLDLLRGVISTRPTWVYASTHDGEEELAARIHKKLKEKIPNLLTIIVPRHPERRGDIAEKLEVTNLDIVFRGEDKNLPALNTDIYIADTLGELGLFYRLSDIAMIGRSFSLDGGGGHNPIEAAQLNCAVLTGPNIQFQEELFEDLLKTDGAKQVMTEEALQDELLALFSDEKVREYRVKNALAIALEKKYIIDNYMKHLSAFLIKEKTTSTDTNNKEAA